jgi:hypothetical protein
VSDLSGHYKPTPVNTADVINELEAKEASMIGGGKDMKRAKVELSFDESGKYVGRGRFFVLARRVERDGVDDTVYWSNDAGWTGRESSTRFTEDQIKTVDMPLGGFWVELDSSIELDAMMSKTEGSGAITMDFERFSQTGGNLAQAQTKRQAGKELTDRTARTGPVPSQVYADAKPDWAAVAAKMKKDAEEKKKKAEQEKQELKKYNEAERPPDDDD